MLTRFTEIDRVLAADGVRAAAEVDLDAWGPALGGHDRRLLIGLQVANTHRIMTQLSDYYRARAAEYDAVYAKHERQEDLAALRGLLTRLAFGRVLEIAAGTGYWTQVLSASAAAVTATDISPETLDVARSRPYSPAPVAFRLADAYGLQDVPGQFDTDFLGFFWSHVPRADPPRFLHRLHARLGEGTSVAVVDDCYVPDSSTP
jgi:SAM-dependent methyltransferase